MLEQDHLEALDLALPSLGPMSEQVTRESRFVTLPPGTVAFEEGSPCENFLVLLSGRVRIVKCTELGREILLYRVSEGEVCVLTLSCLLSGCAYPAKGMVEETAEAIAIPAKLFRSLLDQVAAFRHEVFALLTKRLVEVISLVEAVAFRGLDERLAASLIRRKGLRRDSDLPITHQMLADDLGTSREIVSRLLESFESEGLVGLGRKRITILDPAALRHRSEGMLREPS